MRLSQKIFLKNSEGKYLTILRSATDPSRPLTWDLPGGNIEEGEDLHENMKREIFEETGIVLDQFKIFDVGSAINGRGEYSVQIAYTGNVENPEIKLSYEHSDYRWVTKEEFLELDSSSKIKKFLQKL